MAGDEEKNDQGNGEQTETAEATTGRPRQVESTRATVLVVPPEPTEEQVAEREECIDRTHRESGPPLRRTRGGGVEQPDVPPTDVGEAD